MASSLSNFINHLAEGIHKIKCKYRHDNEKCETCGIKYVDCECCLEYCFNKNYQKKIDENFKKQFVNSCNFSNHDINKFILLLRKGAYPYKYMDDWEKFIGTSLPERENF